MRIGWRLDWVHAGYAGLVPWTRGSTAAVERFFSVLIGAFLGVLSKPVALPQSMCPMTDSESKRFGASLMPLGKFIGKRVDDVEMSYLEFLDEDEWRGQLRRYLLSRRVQEEGDDDGDGDDEEDDEKIIVRIHFSR